MAGACACLQALQQLRPHGAQLGHLVQGAPGLLRQRAAALPGHIEGRLLRTHKPSCRACPRYKTWLVGKACLSWHNRTRWRGRTTRRRVAELGASPAGQAPLQPSAAGSAAPPSRAASSCQSRLWHQTMAPTDAGVLDRS